MTEETEARLFGILMWLIVILACLATGCVAHCQEPLKDDGFGACPAFQHSHSEAPGSCFSDDADALIVPDGDRNRITIDGVVSGPSDEAVQAAVNQVADISEKFKFYLDPKNAFVRLEWELVDKVKADIAVFGTEKDKARFIVESEQLTYDFAILDSYDDMLRISKVI